MRKPDVVRLSCYRDNKVARTLLRAGESLTPSPVLQRHKLKHQSVGAKIKLTLQQCGPEPVLVSLEFTNQDEYDDLAVVSTLNKHWDLPISSLCFGDVLANTISCLLKTTRYHPYRCQWRTLNLQGGSDVLRSHCQPSKVSI